MKHPIFLASGLFLLCSTFVNLLVTAKEAPRFVVSSISPELVRNANAVYWYDRMTYEIESPSRAIFRVAYAVTILNPNGKRHSQVVVGYNKLSRIASLKGTIYDQSGNVIRKVKPSEIYDQSVYDGTLYSDARFKAMDLKHGQYPYTVEVEYEVDYKYLFSIPGFVLLGDENESTHSAEYTLIYPKELKPRFLTRNVTVQPEVLALDKGRESTSWKFGAAKPIEYEPLSEEDFVPKIFAAPSRYSFDGYDGNMESWEGFGQWINTLNKGRDVLPEKTRQEIIKIASAFDSPEEKIQAAYTYLQNKTRYVSIQLGIGGYQPFEASVVDQMGYGDCKALSNYMVSLLSTIGIKSHYTLIDAGRNSEILDTTFPSSQFNHAVVCVPVGKDTVWLECTSQSNPFGYMGSFTGNRLALAITDTGAKVVRTPVYLENENTQIRSGVVSIDENGNARARVSTTYAGLQYETGNLHFILSGNKDEQKKWVEQNTDIPVFDIASFSISQTPGRIPSAKVDLDLVLNKYASVSGKRLFVTPNLMNRASFIPEKCEERKSAVVVRTAYTDIDTIHYEVSDKIYPEFLPQPMKIESRFGTYEASFTVDQGKLVYVRKVTKKKGEFPAESYTELIDFCKAVKKADDVKVVFLTKT